MPILKYLFFAHLLCFGLICFGQSGTIRGFIMDRNTGEPIVFATIKVISPSGEIVGAVSDVNGFFSVGKLDTGKFEVRIESIDYKTLVLNASIKSAEEIIEIKGEIEVGEIEIQGGIIPPPAPSDTKKQDIPYKLSKKDIEKIPRMHETSKSKKMRRKKVSQHEQQPSVILKYNK